VHFAANIEPARVVLAMAPMPRPAGVLGTPVGAKRAPPGYADEPAKRARAPAQ
jgi:hypothetical protein